MTDSSPPAAPPRPRAVRRLFWLCLLSSLLAVSLWQLLRGDDYRPFGPQEFEQARRLWLEAGVVSYDLEVAVSGRQEETYLVEVRHGEVTKALRNGRPLSQSRTIGTWSVPGMFATIQRDIEVVRRFESGRADPGTPQLSLRAKVDPENGLPLRYLRIERVRQGANPEISWHVTRFQPQS